jgi:YegS/Rv2252/BmrU family lipid kinase
MRFSIPGVIAGTYNKGLGSYSGPYRKPVIIYNPCAGRFTQSKGLVKRTLDSLATEGFDVKPVATLGPNTASALAKREIEQGADLILAAGGDGTINEVANGMVHSGVPLGILPAGTANVLAHEIRSRLRLDRIGAELRTAVPTRVSVGRMKTGDGESRYFLLMAGIGLDAQIVYDLNLGLKAIAGKLAYYFGGFAQIAKPLTPFRTTVNGESFETTFALVTRVRNYGGDFELAREASLLSDRFEVVLFDVKHSYQYLPYLLGMMMGQVTRLPGVRILPARRIVCEPMDSNPAPMQVDGEYAGRLPVSIEIVSEALTLLLPIQFLEREQAYLPVSATA